ncbi:MAG: hypothetical protein AAF984_00590 [Verrucomicrobiota bacterium]
MFFLIVLATTSAYGDSVSIVATENAFSRVIGEDRNESETLQVRRHYTATGVHDRLSYLRFDVSSLLPQITQASDIVSATLTLHRINTTSASVENLHVSALLDGVSETAWTAVMGPADRPHGTGSVSANEGITVTSPLGSLPIAAGETGDLSIQLSASDLFALLQTDTNNEITLVLSAAGPIALIKFASITNTSGLPVPTLTVDIASPPSAGTVIMLGSLGGWITSPTFVAGRSLSEACLIRPNP